MVRYSFHLPNPHLEHLSLLASQTGMTVSDHLRRAVERYLVQPDQRAYVPYTYASGCLIGRS